MILVDSSCWVEFYRPHGVVSVQDAVLKALLSGEAATCGMVRVEILGYVKRQKEYDLVSRDFEALLWLDFGQKETDTAIEIGRALRQRGMTVPPTDLLIAGVARTHDAVLLHSDRHFERIAGVHPKLRQQFV